VIGAVSAAGTGQSWRPGSITNTDQSEQAGDEQWRGPDVRMRRRRTCAVASSARGFTWSAPCCGA